MNLISLENISKSYSEKKIIENISLGINTNEKIGLIGVNGTGKSTLLKIIAGFEYYDSGNIIKASNLKVEYLSQNPDYDENMTVIEQVFKGNSVEMKLMLEYQRILDLLSNSFDESLNNKLLKLQEQIDSLNLWDLESQAKMVLTKLGINNFNQKVKELSGGQRKRISLASALITPCDLLILDEPTNHLDNDTIDWLEEYLNSMKISLLMITHDRYFLDRVTNRIIELDKGNLYSYMGNYSDFLEKKMERVSMENSSEQKRQSLIRKELAWVQRGAKARTTKQKARLERFDELINQDGVSIDENVDISVACKRLGNKIIEINNISKSFGDKTLIKNFEYTLAKEDKIGIIGKNGIGKSTLINLLTNKITPDEGFIDVGETVRIGCFSQDDAHMNPNMKALDYVKEGSDYIETSDGSKISASQMCERFLFNSTMQHTLISKLSGGERRRLHLLRVLIEAPNVLLLDEPTNDLDIETLKRLEDYLDNFKGVLITVSHDRYFLDRVCNKIFAYEDNSNIIIYTGNYSDYKVYKENNASLLNSFDDVKSDTSKSVKKEKPKNNTKLKFSYKEQREFESIDSDIETLENKIASLEEDTNKYTSDFTKLQEILNKKQELENQLEFKYERWEFLNDLNEKINNQ